MSEEAKAPATPDHMGSMANILKEYVPKSEHNTLLDAWNASDAKIKKLEAAAEKYKDYDTLKTRAAELEGKVRAHNYQAAYKGLVDELKINPDFADEVFELAKLTTDKDEPDLKAMKSILTDFLELKPKFLRKNEEQPAEQPKPKPVLKTEDSGRGSQHNIGQKFRYNASDLSNPEWMRLNGDAFAEASLSGTVVRAGD